MLSRSAITITKAVAAIAISSMFGAQQVLLLPLQPDDREQFILDNQWAFKYGAQQEFGMRDERC